MKLLEIFFKDKKCYYIDDCDISLNIFDENNTSKFYKLKKKIYDKIGGFIDDEYKSKYFNKIIKIIDKNIETNLQNILLINFNDIIAINELIF